LRFVRLAKRSSDETAVAPARGVSRLDFKRPNQQRSCRRVVAPLMMQDAEVMQRFGVHRIDCQRFPVERRSLIELACLMGCECGCKQRVDVGWCGRFGASVTAMKMLFHENLPESVGARVLRAPAG
jgi:hypothetical protein